MGPDTPGPVVDSGHDPTQPLRESVGREAEVREYVLLGGSSARGPHSGELEKTSRLGVQMLRSGNYILAAAVQDCSPGIPVRL